MVVLEVLVLVGVAILWLVPSVVCFLKGKWVSGLVGIIGITVVVGWIWACGAAVRLAKPGSVWARKRYFGEKLARAREVPRRCLGRGCCECGLGRRRGRPV